MKKISATHFGKCKVTMYLANTKKPTWSNGNHDHYRVKIQHEGKSHTFDFWGSIANKENSQLENVKEALHCFASDCDLGSEDFKEFCWKSGASEDSIKDLKAFKACQKSYKAMKRLNIHEYLFRMWLDSDY
jgi:hypothetical protein